MSEISRWGTVAAAFLALASLAPAQADDPAAAERGRTEVAALVARALERAPAATGVSLEAQDAAIPLTLRAVQGPGLRVLATSGEDEAREVARALAAAQIVFGELVGQTVDFPATCRAFLIEKPHRDAFLASFTNLAEDQRAFLASVEGAGIPGTFDWGFWALDPEHRRDGTVRLAFDWFLRKKGVTLEEHAWLHEGLGLYLTHALLGTHRTWFVPPRVSGTRNDTRNAELKDSLQDPDADWLSTAREVYAPKTKYDLEELLHLEPAEMDAMDHLAAVALVAYVVEVRRDALSAILAGVGEGTDPRQVLEKTLGAPLKELRGRLGPWLEQRSASVARAEGRRTEAELVALWNALPADGKNAAIAGFRRRLETLDTGQMRTVRGLLAATTSEAPAAAGELPFYDPKEHAPANPIPRKRLPATDGRVKKTLKTLEKARKGEEPPPVPAIDYDWGSARVVRRAEPPAPEAVFRDALRGVPPDADLARALALQALDRADERKLHAAFGHAYADRDGNVFPITLYEAWLSGTTIEMPDTDILGIVHDVVDEWKRWTAPIPASEHTAVYKLVGQLFKRCRSARELREACVDVLFVPSSARPGYESLQTNLHVAWAEAESSPAKLAAVLPEGKVTDDFLNTLVERCKADPTIYSRGRRRAAELRLDVVALQRALGEALEEAARGPNGGEGAGR